MKLWISHGAGLLLTSLAIAFASDFATALEPGGATAQPQIDRSTPRASVEGYLSACRQADDALAAHYLDLAPVPAPERERQGPILARQLKTVLDRTLWVDLEQLSSEPQGNQEDGLSPRRDKVGVIQSQRGAFDVFVDRQRLAGGEQIWRISPTTVARIPALYDEFGEGPLARYLPKALVEVSIFEVALWQWLALLCVLLAAYLAAWLLAGTVVRLLGPLVARSGTAIDDRLLANAVGPIRLLVTVGMFALGAAPLGLSIPARRFFVGAEMALSIFGIAWLVFRLIDLSSAVVKETLEARGQAGAIHLVPLGVRAIKVAVFALALLAALDNFGLDVTALIAGLGVGGIALALAAQKTLENVFGGATLLADQPVRPGEFCRYGDKIGTVEDIGLRSTRVRTLDRTIVTVPNAEFSTLHIENFAVRDRMRLTTTLGLRYETTPDQLRYVLVELRKLLWAHPKVCADPVRARFIGFAAFSLDIEIFCYIDTQDWNEFLAIREDIFLRLMDVVNASGSGFAFPSQTTYLARDEGNDAARTEAAEAQVAEWRRQTDLQFPDFTAERIQEIDGTLDYPPSGSPHRAR